MNTTATLWNELNGIDHLGAMNLLVGCTAKTVRTRKVSAGATVKILAHTTVPAFRGGGRVPLITVQTEGGAKVDLGSWASLEITEYPQEDVLQAAIRSRSEYLRNLD